ncbi:MAG: nucleotide exchange factor GrpE [Lactobacillales bacterium]|jgi:molecular chaperone GrpE|nr:nucleotide exchange factor GrpE [Lactobacillales bacterium]
MTKKHKEAHDTDQRHDEMPAGGCAPEIEEKIVRLTEEVQHAKDQWLRTQAEMDNLRKRTKIDLEKGVKYANFDFAKDLLDVADYLDGALKWTQNEEVRKENAKKDAFLENLAQGVEMTKKQLENVFKKHGVERMETLGKIFNPELHQVVQQVDDEDNAPGTIIQELQTGYTIYGDRVLREAMVVVSK